MFQHLRAALSNLLGALARARNADGLALVAELELEHGIAVVRVHVMRETRPGSRCLYFEGGEGKNNLAKRISTPMFSLNPPLAWKS
jgi:hypothetical protein